MIFCASPIILLGRTKSQNDRLFNSVIFSRSLVREFSQTGFSVALSLLGILVTVSAVKLMGLAAGGSLAADAVLAMLGFGALNYMPIVLSASVFIALLLTLSRCWRESEMVVWFASGLSFGRFVAPVLIFAVPLSILVALMSLLISPWALQQKSVYQTRLDSRDDVSLVAPGVFRESKNTDQVFFVDSLSDEEHQVSNVFVQSVQNGKLGVTVAAKGFVRTEVNGDRFMVLLNGRRYEGTPGNPDYSYTNFSRAELRIEQRAAKLYESNSKGKSVSELWQNPTPENMAELHWRIGLPVSLIVLSLISIPLSYVNTRSARTANLLMAILCYMVYYNLMSIAQSWTVAGRFSTALGIWPVHIFFFGLFLVMMGFRTQFGGLLRRR